MRVLALLAITGMLWAQPAEQARGVLRDGFVEKGPDKRREVAIALSLIPTQDPSADLLVTLAKDKDVPVRQAALQTIAELGDKKRYAILKEGLADEVPEVAYAAARALWSVGDPDGRALLEDIFEEEAKAKSGFVKGEIRGLMRKIKTPQGAMLLAVRGGLGFVPVPGLGMGFSAVTSMLNDNDFSARATSLLLLCQKKTGSCEAMITRGLSDEDWSVRAAAIQLIAAHRDTALRGKVAGLFADKSEKVRYRAAATYLRLESNKPIRPRPSTPPPAR